MELSSSAEIRTDKASRYLQQLCKHFAHKRPVEFTPERGAIRFDFGACALEARGDVLHMQVTAANDDDLADMRDVIERHLVRFAFREPPAIVWS